MIISKLLYCLKTKSGNGTTYLSAPPADGGCRGGLRVSYIVLFSWHLNVWRTYKPSWENGKAFSPRGKRFPPNLQFLPLKSHRRSIFQSPWRTFANINLSYIPKRLCKKTISPYTCLVRQMGLPSNDKSFQAKRGESSFSWSPNHPPDGRIFWVCGTFENINILFIV